MATIFDHPRENIVNNSGDKLPPCFIPRKDATKMTLKPHVGGTIWQTDQTSELRSSLVSAIDSAKNIVCVASFLIADAKIIDAMLKASSRGVRVYLLTASEAQLLKELREDSEFELKRREEVKEILQKLAGKVLVRSADNLHTKFILVDPKSENARGFLLTANLTTEALTRNPELAVQLGPDLTNDLFRQFLIGFWKESQNELFAPTEFTKAGRFSTPNIPPPSRFLCTMSDSQTIRSGILQLIEGSEGEIMVSTFGIGSDHSITESLIKAAKEGRKLRVLVRVRSNEDNMKSLIALSNSRAEVRAHRYVHAKAVVAKSSFGWRGIIMTSNIEAKGLDEGFETGILVEGEDADQLHKVLEDWWSEFPLDFSLSPKRGDVEGEVILWNQGHLINVTIQKLLEKDLGNLEAPSMELMENQAPASFTVPHIEDKGTLYHKCVFRWTVVPPRLPSDAKPVKEEVDKGVPLYRKGNETFLAIKSREDLEKAILLKPKTQSRIVFAG